MNTQSIKKAIAAGLIGLTALGTAVVVPSSADAQEAPTEVEGERPDRSERQARRAERRAALAESLGLDVDALQAAREDGQSIADIAAATGADINAIIASIVENKTAHIEEHVAAGDITREQADERLDGLTDRVTERVNAEPGERGERGRRGNRG